VPLITQEHTEDELLKEHKLFNIVLAFVGLANVSELCFYFQVPALARSVPHKRKDKKI
jgi:hypothetical protein